ncbi:MAG TPA: zinc-ribbon domain-containing protein [Gemmatimonadales bacterium]|nr:zinc-ribbon domain-containing protein [Gemmatimonadales bacterium]
MNATCPQCQTVFRVDPAKVPEAGVRARCSVCAGVFWVRHEAEPAAAPAAPIAAFAPSRPAPSPPRPAPSPPAPTPVAAPPAPPAPPRPAPAPAAPAAPTPAPYTAPRAAPPAVAPGSMPAPAAPAYRPATPPAPAFRPAPASPVPVAAPVAPAAYSAPAPPTPSPQPPAPSPRRPTNPFLSQDPEARARRLARALVSDIVVYHPAKRRDALRDGSLKLLFEEEIRKSWEEYVDQVGRELADSTTFFTDALNEILADGQPVFP